MLAKSDLLMEINTIKSINKQHEMAVERARDLIEYLEKYVRDYLISSDKDFESVVVFGEIAGCATSQWSPKITFYCQNLRYIGGNRLVLTNSNSHGAIHHNEIVKGKIPFDGFKLLNLCNELTELLGIPVGFHETGIIL